MFEKTPAPIIGSVIVFLVWLFVFVGKFKFDYVTAAAGALLWGVAVFLVLSGVFRKWQY